MAHPVFSMISDGYQNLVSRLGSGPGAGSANVYSLPFIGQQQIEAAYRTSWLSRKVHDLVPFEMTRAERDWQAESDQIEQLENEEMRLGLWPKLCKAATVARLHGGSALILGVNGAGAPSDPLDVESVKQGALRYVYVASRHQLTNEGGGDFDYDPESDGFGAPKMWGLAQKGGTPFPVHPSRVITFHGSPLPPGGQNISPIDAFWGDPLLTSIKSAIDNAEGSQASVSALLHQAKQDVLTIPGLTASLATVEGEKQLEARIRAASTFRSMFNTLLLDGGDPSEPNSGEEWETRQIAFTQMPEVLDAFIGVVAGATDIPKTRLMGASPGGMNSTGKGEQDDFNRMIRARQNTELRPPLARLDEVLLRSTLGSRPPEVWYRFAPLEEADEKQAAEIEKLEAETVDIYARNNFFPSAEFSKAVHNRLVESGRFPGLETITEADIDANQQEADDKEAEAAAREAANENTVQRMAKAGAIGDDMALTLLADASPRSLYVRRNLLNGAELAKWAKGQGFAVTTPPEEMHVTIAFSRTPVDWMKVGDEWAGEDGTLTVAPGGPRMVERLGDEGAVVLLFSSSQLGWRHERIKREAGASWDYAEYQPHVTITYEAPEGLDLATVEPFRGALRFGPEIFEEVDEGWGDRLTER